VSGEWIVTGCEGQLGNALLSALEAIGVGVIPLSHASLDIGDERAIGEFLGALSGPPSVLVNAAAYNQVDRCEQEREAAVRCNALGPELLAKACLKSGTRFVHVSTDYVFAGDAKVPYREDDPTGPICVYGETKLDGERRVQSVSDGFLVLRTSWLFGKGKNFIRSILGHAARRREGIDAGPIQVVADQVGRPTHAPDLADAIIQLVEAEAKGLYHVANDGIASWWDVARFCLDESGYGDLVAERIQTRDLALPARRPAWSVLDCSRAEALGVRMRDWREAIRAYLRAEARDSRC
jgi:dTDP-4-dehydrorhamnose reductase